MTDGGDEDDDPSADSGPPSVDRDEDVFSDPDDADSTSDPDPASDVDPAPDADESESGSTGATDGIRFGATPDEAEGQPGVDEDSPPSVADREGRSDSLDDSLSDSGDGPNDPPVSGPESEDGLETSPGPENTLISEPGSRTAPTPEAQPKPKVGPQPPETESALDPRSSPIRWALRTDHGPVVFLRDVLSSVATVFLVAVLLFAISGIWPPLVAVESGSMEPHMHRGDLVFLIDEQRFTPDAAVEGTGVVTYRKGQETGYWSFGNYGNVVVYRPDGGGSTPIIHRARFYVEKGDNWVAEANEEYLGGVDTCAETMTCPAPHDGFITKGDHNGQYDQISGQSTVVKPSWIKGRAKVRVPWLGYVRLWLGSTAAPTSLGTGGTPAVGGLVAGLIARLELAVAALGGMQVARTVR